MSLIEVLRSVAINITENKVKVLLTMLGIIVGTVTVIVVLAVGRGSQSDVEEQYKNLNIGTLQVVQAFGRSATVALTDDVAALISEQSTHLKYVSMVQNTKANIVYDSLSNNLTVIGASEELQYINNLEVEHGRFITAADNDNKERVAVIGRTMAETYFEDDPLSALGEDISINNRKYEIVGILEYQGDSSMRDMNPDEAVIIPYQVAEKYMTGRMVRPSIMILAQNMNVVEAATEEVQTVIDTYYEDDTDKFMIIDAGSRLVAAKASAKSITLMLLIIAIVVLIVGGIGIMNVLFVSVKERTREIGILKAIGATKSDIMRIFLYEAMAISLFGSLIGTLLSLSTFPIFSYFGVSAVFSPFDLGISVGFSMAIGTFFGIYPAAKAANLKPIDALNYE